MLLPFSFSVFQRISPNITSWNLAWIVKELVVLDWFHFLETAVICISLMLINRMSSFDLVYQFALIAVVELFYYCLNILCCFFLLYYELWYHLNVKVIISNFNDTNREEDISVFLRCLDSYASLLKNNRRWRVLVENIAEADDIL